MRIGTVRELWRYPVKSMGGERIDATTAGTRGLHGDRLWAIRDIDREMITGAKRLPALLLLSARFESEPAPGVAPGAITPVRIDFPDGTAASSRDPDIDARLSAFLGKPVSLVALRDASDKAFFKAPKATGPDMREQFAIEDGDALPDFSMMPLAKLLELGSYTCPPGTYFDAMALHVVTTASLHAFDARRFRPNVIVDTGAATGYLESAWTGATLSLGAATAFVDCPTPRCSMPTRAQLGGVPADKTVLATLVRDADRCLGAYATVTRPGDIRTNDEVSLDAPSTSALGDWARRRATGIKRVLLRAAMPK